LQSSAEHFKGLQLHFDGTDVIGKFDWVKSHVQSV